MAAQDSRDGRRDGCLVDVFLRSLFMVGKIPDDTDGVQPWRQKDDQVSPFIVKPDRMSHHRHEA